jgi:hypothetical protein
MHPLYPCVSSARPPSHSFNSSETVRLCTAATVCSAPAANSFENFYLRCARGAYAHRFSVALQWVLLRRARSGHCCHSSLLPTAPGSMEAQQQARKEESWILPVFRSPWNGPSIPTSLSPAQHDPCCGSKAGRGCGGGRRRRSGESDKAIEPSTQEDSPRRMGRPVGPAALSCRRYSDRILESAGSHPLQPQHLHW